MQITVDIGLTKFTSVTIEIDPEDVDLIEGKRLMFGPKKELLVEGTALKRHIVHRMTNSAGGRFWVKHVNGDQFDFRRQNLEVSGAAQQRLGVGHKVDPQSLSIADAMRLFAP